MDFAAFTYMNMKQTERRQTQETSVAEPLQFNREDALKRRDFFQEQNG
jgi:hypothetical protein